MHLNKSASTIEILLGDCQSKVADALTGAIRRGDIWPGFQPIVDLASGRIAGFEILARWSTSSEGELAPCEFIPLLERFGLIDQFSDTLVSRACQSASEWAGNFFLAFNISPAQLARVDLAGRIASLANSAHFPVSQIYIEVTEGTLISDDAITDEILREMVALGMHVAIDDFGTGYSSLARLEAFPFSKLKIDRRFISSMAVDARKRRIVSSVLGLGQSLGMSVVAEGVETLEEETCLRSLGCCLGQGWLYGKAVKAEEAAEQLAMKGSRERSAPVLDMSPFQRLHQLSAFYRAAPIGLCFVDRLLRYVDVNESFAALHGLSPKEMVGRRIAEVLDEEMATTVEEVLQSLLTTDLSTQSRYHMAGKDVLIFNSRVTETDSNSVIGFTAISIDVTENVAIRKLLAQREDSFREILHLHADVEWTASPDGIFDYISPTLTDLPEEGMRARIARWLGRIHPADRERVIREWFNWIPSRLPYEAEFRALDADGSFRWIRSRARPRLNSRGEVEQWHGIATDITEIVRLRNKLTTLARRFGSAPE